MTTGPGGADPEPRVVRVVRLDGAGADEGTAAAVARLDAPPDEDRVVAAAVDLTGVADTARNVAPVATFEPEPEPEPEPGSEGGVGTTVAPTAAPLALFDSARIDAAREAVPVAHLGEKALRGGSRASGRPRSRTGAARSDAPRSEGTPSDDGRPDGTRTDRTRTDRTRSGGNRSGGNRSGGNRPGGGENRWPRDGAPAELDPDADPLATARSICLRLLTDRARTRQELAQALRRKGVPDEAADAVLARFGEVGLIDDAAFAGQWVRSRHAGRGLGRRALALELRRKGVDDEVAGEALAEVDADAEAVRARQLVDRKLRTMPAGTGEERVVAGRRLAGMLARKGYGAGVAYRVVREALADRGAEIDELGDTDPHDD